MELDEDEYVPPRLPNVEENEGEQRANPPTTLSEDKRFNEEEEMMPKVKNPYTGRVQAVSSKVRVGAPGSPRQRSYCARTAKIGGNWRRNKTSRNLIQRRRWKCPYIPGELRL